MLDSQPNLSNELVSIYSTLRWLGCNEKIVASQRDENSIDFSIYSRRFLLKLLDDRFEDLAQFADQICEDLFKQIGVNPKKVDQHQLDTLDKNVEGILGQLPSARYPEFDKYFHCCLHHLHDFFLDLRWHETDIEVLTKGDSDYVSKNLNFFNSFLKFRESLVNNTTVDSANLRKPPNEYTTTSPDQEVRTAKTPKSNLAAPSGSPSARSTSPSLRRRVRFKSSLTQLEDTDMRAIADRRTTIDRDLQEVHSILALDLLIHGIDIFVQKLRTRCQVWSSDVRSKLTIILEEILNSSKRMRARQLQLVAKRVKIYIDVQLTVLDYVNEIKTTYLIDNTLDIVCAMDTERFLEGFKKPRIYQYIQRCLVIERGLLSCLVEQFLDIFFNLVIGEMNFPPVELEPYVTPKVFDDANKSHENVLKFISAWLQVEDVLFGYGRPKENKHLSMRTQMEKVANQIQRPKIVAKSSTLSSNGAYASSSRILAQMDNLVEFLKDYLSVSSIRLRNKQQAKFFFESVMTSVFEFFKIVSERLNLQLLSTQSNPSRQNSNESVISEKSTITEDNIDLMIVKVRCLKFIHIMTSVEKLVRAEAKRVDVQQATLDQLILSLNKFMKICMGFRSMKEINDRRAEQSRKVNNK